MSKSDEAVAANKRKRALEQYSADRKRLLREKRKTAVAAAAVQVDGGEAEDADNDPINHCFLPQTVAESFQINHEEMGNDTVSREGFDNWKEPFWFDKWHPKQDNPASASDDIPNKYVTTTDNLADLDLHMVADALEVKKMRMSDLDITLWSDRGTGRAQLIIYRRRRAQLNKRMADSLRILQVVMGKKLVGFFCGTVMNSVVASLIV